MTGLTSGGRNVAIGYSSGNTIATGNDNVYIGDETTASSSSVSDEIVIGNHITGGGTETVTIGNDTDSIENTFGTNATWAHSSDERIKKNIVDNDLGLEFVKKLKTRKFQKKAQSEYPEKFNQYDADKTERKDPDKIHYGFVAQEVKKAMDEVGHSDFTVWREHEDGMQLLGEAEFITPLIKAVQELSTQVDTLTAELSALKGE